MLLSIRRMLGCDRASSALEFGLVAPMFFGFLFTFYDVGLHMLRQALLSSAVDKTVRELRIGKGPADVDEFTQVVCRRSLIMPRCDDTLVVSQVKIERGSDLPDEGVTCAEREPGGTVLKPSLEWTQGTPPDVMYVRVCALANSLIGGPWGVGRTLKDENGDTRITTTTAYMSE